MFNVRLPATIAALVALSAGGAAARAAVMGPHAAHCARGGGPAMLVHVTGFKVRSGTVRVQSYGGDPARWFAKHSYIERVEAAVPRAGALDVCMAVAAPGTYAVSVRHDANGSGKADRADGGGMSGNPRLSLFDVMFKRRPDPATVAVEVPRGVREVPVVLNYVAGASFRPVDAAN